MTITIRDYTTGEAIRSWNQPGSKRDVVALAHQYAVGVSKVMASKGRVEVWVVQ